MDNYKSEFSKVIMDYLSIRLVSVGERTYKTDVRNLHCFDNFFFNEYEGKSSFDYDNIIKWQISLEKEHGKESKIQTVRAFLQYYSIVSNKKIYIPKAKRKNNEYVPYIFSDEEFQKIIEFTDNYEKQENFENSMILRILYGSGLRIDEVLNLKMENFHIESGCLFLKHTKFKKERLVPLHPSLSNILELYCYKRQLIGKSDSFIFPSNNDVGHITRNSVYSVFKSAMKYAGINLDSRRQFERGPCIHGLRHVFTMKSCLKLEKQGYSVYDALPYISFYLGHDSIYETQEYLKYKSEMFPFELQKFENLSSSLYPEAKDDI